MGGCDGIFVWCGRYVQTFRVPLYTEIGWKSETGFRVRLAQTSELKHLLRHALLNGGAETHPHLPPPAYYYICYAKLAAF